MIQQFIPGAIMIIIDNKPVSIRPMCVVAISEDTFIIMNTDIGQLHIGPPCETFNEALHKACIKSYALSRENRPLPTFRIVG